MENTFGVKGFFIAMNDVGLSILLLNALSCYCYLKTNKKKYLLAALIMSVSAAFVGSMACYFGTAGVLLCLFLNLVFIKMKDYKSSYKQRVIAIIIALIAVVPVLNLAVETIANDDFLSKKYENVSSTFTEMSSRGYLMEAANRILNQYSLSDWLFGTGAQFHVSMQYMLRYTSPKGVEVDPYDLVGVYGIIFTIVLIWFSLRILLTAIKRFVVKRDLLSYWLIVGLMLYLGHGIYGGHAYTSPVASTYLVVFIYLFYRQKEIGNYL
jgi:hypothetical protein